MAEYQHHTQDHIERLGPTENIVCEREDEETFRCTIDDPTTEDEAPGRELEVEYLNLAPFATEWSEVSPDTIEVGLNRHATCEYRNNEDIGIGDQLVCGIRG
ncbi:hypothetical protein NP511_18065 [Natrinema thermotolerans]|uniref:Uncharacterized protein n=1 Tax=Natrinema thermotolerans TaxID=121872 RepID=A0AAF0P963_9EURY|nr:hypothetical protein [Natrinema thermotolerans]QCC60263.1 hypothetical protein DVR14_17135 [Natrinema thermotolerans]QCC61174.1 hypothetical protein DVR14_21265 [Natrinema thermotolerans]WMT07282.1 hypothetical protein NP511_18065 [Natrinema thermotolerans]